MFSGLANPFEATRYHSLVIARDEPAGLPGGDRLDPDRGRARRDEIMGVRHRELPIQGVQFHPESILTQHGHDLLEISSVTGPALSLPDLRWPSSRRPLPPAWSGQEPRSAERR